MAFINNLQSLFLSAEPELTNIFGKFIYVLYKGIGNFGWAIVVFTLILKTVMLPLDIWQRSVMRKNANAMKRMKPQLEKLQKQCGSDRQAYSQKQMELYKKEGYSMIGSCIPMIVTMVIFFVIFAGFRKVVTYQNEYTIWKLTETYNEMSVQKAAIEESGDQAALEEYTKLMDETLIEQYKENMEGWLWVKNIFMPDSWADVVPSKAVYTGNKIGQLGAHIPENLNVNGDYDTLTAPIAAELNKEKAFDIKNWNGYLILPILMLVLNIFQMLLTPQPKPEDQPGVSAEQAKQQQTTSKMMQFLMPVMMVVFSVLYSSAFSIYMLVSSLFTVTFSAIYTFVTKKIDSKKEDERLTYTFKN